MMESVPIFQTGRRPLAGPFAVVEKGGRPSEFSPLGSPGGAFTHT